MKNIIIVGPPRIGKTTLAKLIINEIPIYNVINVDVIREGIYYSVLKDMEKKERKKLVRETFPDFLRTMLNQYTNYYNPELFYVIEGDLLTLSNALEIKKDYDVEIVCIRTPSISKEELFERIRDNAKKKGCWTNNIDDSELLKLCGEIIQESQENLELSMDNDVVYLDNSYDKDCLFKYVECLKNQKSFKKTN